MYLGLRRIGLAALALLVFSTLLLAPATPAAAIGMRREVAAWIPWWDQARAYRSFTDHAGLYSSVSPFWYEMRSSTEIDAYPGADDSTIVTGVRSRGVLLIPTITNAFDPERVSRMLASPVTQLAHVSRLVLLVVENGYDGIDVDYENLFAHDRDRYSAFISDLAAALHAVGKRLYVAVHPKTSSPGSWNGPRAHDYVAIGRAADRVRVMAYDFHYSGSRPGPIAPIWWVREVARFAARTIPRAKVQLGTPLYGYDWTNGRGEGLMFDESLRRRRAHDARRRWSDRAAAPWFRYSSGGSAHEVWYEDAASVRRKLAVVDRFRLAGSAFWRLGGEDPRVWSRVRALWQT